jgi:retron-type reverse transcriptase
VKLSFKIKGKIKTFHDNHNLKQFKTNKPAQQKVVKRILHSEEKERYESLGKNKS